GESAGGEDFSAPSKPSSGLKISVLKTEKYTPPKKEKKRGGYVFPTVDLLPEAKRGADYPE
ncbi:MAG: hypothetical protein J6P03_07165, partial [Opitutales bacterium]|nr:hypothetical protein [Opitutales bacterium]